MFYTFSTYMSTTALFQSEIPILLRPTCSVVLHEIIQWRITDGINLGMNGESLLGELVSSCRYATEQEFGFGFLAWYETPSVPDGVVLVLPHTGSITVWNVTCLFFLWQGVSSLVVLWLYRPAYRGLRRAADVSRSPSRIHFTKRVNTPFTYLTFFHV